MPSLKYEKQDFWPIALSRLEDAERYVWIIDHEAAEHVVIQRQFKVYMMTCRPTGERYIGVTERHPKDRLTSHAYTAFHPKRRKTLVQKAIVEFGIAAFSVETIGVASSVSEACELERQMIQKHRTLREDGGFNECWGGGGIRVSIPVYHYLDLYQCGQANVVQRIPRNTKKSVRKEPRPKPKPDQTTTKGGHLYIVGKIEMPQEWAMDEGAIDPSSWMRELEGW